MMRLVVANLNYSSWSMRAYLGLKVAGAEFRLHDVGMFEKPNWKDNILQFSGAGTVPILVDGSLTIHESLAILETMAERFPEAGLWPKDAALRARARAISSEMACDFQELRSQMPCNLRGRAARPSRAEEWDEKLEANIRRVFDIFSASLSTSEGPYLLGGFGIVDCMYMPVLARFRAYGVELSPPIERYSAAVFAHPAVVELEKLARDTAPIARYDAYLNESAD